MKFSVTVLCLLATGVANAFAPPMVSFASKNTRLFAEEVAAAESSSDFASAMGDEYERFGVTKDEIGLGVDVNELLQWCGT